MFIQVEKPNQNGLQELIPSEGAAVYKGKTKLFGCKKDGEGVTHHGDTEINIGKKTDIF